MRPLVSMYWLRFAFGVLAGFLSASYVIATDTKFPAAQPLSLLFNSLSIALVIFLLSYYVMKYKFKGRVEKQTKLFSTGVGIYFLSWIVFWVLLYTFIGWLLGWPTP